MRFVVYAFIAFACAFPYLPAYAAEATSLRTVNATEWEGNIQAAPRPEAEKVKKKAEFKIDTTLSADAAAFAHGNAWFGEATANIGKKSNLWFEGDVKPGVIVESDFYGQTHLTAALNAIVAGQTGDIDAAGSTNPYEDALEVLFEDAYVKIESGSNFSSLGENAVYFSVGRQQYKVGNGLLIKSGSSNGGRRGAFWLGPRKAFEMAAIVGLDTKKLSGEMFYLQPDDNPNTETKTGGANLDWKPFEKTKVGFMYMNFMDGSTARDGMDVWNIRASTYPFKSFPTLGIGGEYVIERNGNLKHADAGWIGALYGFDKLKWKPSIGYRYAVFSGDKPGTTRNEAFDPLFYGSTDWGTWYQGEILGEYALSNSNLESHGIRLRGSPTDDVTLTGTYYHFRLPEPATFGAGVASSHYADEIDFLVDWTIHEKLTMSGMVGVAFPGDGAKQATGGDDNWTQALVSFSWNF